MPISSQIKPIYKLLLSTSTAFTPASANVIIGSKTQRTPTNKLLNYYAKQGVLRNIRKGVYVKPEYNPLEVACMLYPPCYISLHYVLLRSGVIFQYTEDITCVSYLSRRMEVDGHTMAYYRINPELIINFKGIILSDTYSIATPERAFLDMYYLYPSFYFDHTDGLDRALIKEILPVYKNRALEERVCKLLNITDYECRAT